MRDKSSGKKFKPILFKVNLPPKVRGKIKYLSTFSVFYISKKKITHEYCVCEKEFYFYTHF